MKQMFTIDGRLETVPQFDYEGYIQANRRNASIIHAALNKADLKPFDGDVKLHVTWREKTLLRVRSQEEVLTALSCIERALFDREIIQKNESWRIVSTTNDFFITKKQPYIEVVIESA